MWRSLLNHYLKFRKRIIDFLKVDTHLVKMFNNSLIYKWLKNGDKLKVPIKIGFDIIYLGNKIKKKLMFFKHRY